MHLRTKCKTPVSDKLQAKPPPSCVEDTNPEALELNSVQEHTLRTQEASATLLSVLSIFLFLDL